MATIYKIRNSRFWYISYVDNDGKRVQKSLGTTNKRIAEEKQVETEHRLSRGQLGLPTRSAQIPLAKAIDDYLKVCEANHAPKTLLSDRAALANFQEFARDRAAALGAVSLQLLEEYKIHRRAQVSESSVNHDLRVIKAFVNRCVAERKLPESPFRDAAGKNLLKKLVVVRNPPRFFSIEEIDRIMASEQRPRWKAIIVVGLNTGLRKGELQYLTWERSIDFQNRQIMVVEDGDFRPKGRRIRTIPMTDACREALETVLRTGRYVFGVDGGKPFINNFNTQFKKILNRAGIENASPHTLRHTFAAHLIMKGIPLRTVADYLGHSETEVTELYGSLSPHHRNEAIRALPYSSTPGRVSG